MESMGSAQLKHTGEYERQRRSSATGDKETRDDKTCTTNSMERSRLVGNKEKGCTSGYRRSGYSDVRLGRPGSKRRGLGLEANLSVWRSDMERKTDIRVYGPTTRLESAAEAWVFLRSRGGHIGSGGLAPSSGPPSSSTATRSSSHMQVVIMVLLETRMPCISPAVRP